LAGAGTVIGSELFNLLVIVGSVCLLSGGAGLVLDWRILAREAGFFALSLSESDANPLLPQDGGGLVGRADIGQNGVGRDGTD
jgi:hypothetical protein